MNGARGFFSAAGSAPDKALPEGGTTRVSAGTRPRKTPGTGAATSQDFFASLGMNATSSDRKGSSNNTTTTSNLNYNNRVTHPSTALGTRFSATPTTSSSPAWRPPTIGGLNVTPPPPPSMPAVGSCSLSAATTASVSVPGLSGTGLALGTAPVTCVATAKTKTRPTQLFAMEDTEELYSDDGWDCDSPSTVLSNPTDETETTDPVLAAVKAAGDNCAWGGNDDGFASPVAKETKAPSNANEVSGGGAFEMKAGATMHQTARASVDKRFATEIPVATQVPSQAQTVSAALPPPAAMPAASFSTLATSSTFETTGHVRTREVKSMRPPPSSTTVSSTFFPVESTYNAFEPTSCEAPRQASLSVPTSIFREPYQQDEQWNDDSGQQEPSDTGSETMATNGSTSVRTVAVTTTIRTGTFVTPSVELTSPVGAAGEFWGDGDEDKLFDHDEYAGEEWNESIKDSTNEPNSMALSSRDKKCHVKSTTLASFSLPYLPSSLEVTTNLEKSTSIAHETVSALNYFVSEHSDEVKNSSQEEMIDQLSEDTKMSTIGSSIEPSLAAPPKTEDSEVPLHSVESTQLAKPKASLGTEGSPFSSATAESTCHENDPNVLSETPHNARFLHTPTGTGGPFGRQGNENSTFPEEITGTVVNEAGHNSRAFASREKGETSDSYTESSVRWDPRVLHKGEHVQMSSGEQANDDDGDTRRTTHHGPSDEEERDSVVSFSGENSYFPSSGRPSSLYGGSQSSFASHRMYQSSIASTDHEGSSIASFGVSSAGATFGGSERVSEGGAFSDGTVSETPSMVDSSNASTAFGTDFPSVSEGQFSAPGTTVGGSDNASDGEFSADSASETTSLCGSVNTDQRFAEFSSSSRHLTETAEPCGTPELFALSAPESSSVATIGESPTVVALPNFGGDGTASDVNPFASSPSVVLSSQHASNSSPATALADSSYDHRSEGTVQEDNVQSAASLFGATAGSDVPNPFGLFGASPAVNGANTFREHELPTSDAGDLFGSGPSSSGFESSFARPAQNSYSSNYQMHGQNYKQNGSGSGSATQTSALNLAQSQSSFPSSNDQPAGGESIFGRFQSQRPSNYNRADAFASRDAQLGFDNSAPSADSVFGNGGKPSVDRGASSYFGQGAQASADDIFGRLKSSTATACDHLGQQASIYSASHGGDESFNQYGSSVTTACSEQASVVTSNREVQSSSCTATNTFLAQSHGQSGGDVAAECTTTSAGFGPSNRQSPTSSFTSNATLREASGFGGQNHFGRSIPGSSDNYSQQSATTPFSSASRTQQSYGSQQIGQRSTLKIANNYDHHFTASPAQSNSNLQDNSYPHNGKTATHGPAGGFGDHVRSSPSAATDAFFGRSYAANRLSSASDVGGEHVTTPSTGSIQQQLVQQQPPVLAGSSPSFLQSGSNVSFHARQHGIDVSINPTLIRSSLQRDDLNASYGSIQDTNLSRRGSSSSMSRYGSDASPKPQRNIQQQKSSTSVHPSVDATSFFGVAHSATSEDVSSVFGDTVLQDSSEMVASHPVSNDSNMYTVPQCVPLPHQEHDFLQEQSHRETGGATTTAVSASATEAIPRTDVESSSEMPTVRRDERLQQHEANSTIGSPLVFTKADAHAAPTAVDLMPTSATEKDVNHPQAFNGFSDTGSSAFGDETSYDFFLSSPAPQTTASLSHQFEHKRCGQQPEQPHQARDDAAASPQFAYSTLSYDDGSVRTSGGHLGSNFDSRVPEAGAVCNATHSQQQQHSQPQQHQHQYQSSQQQQRSELHHAVTRYGYRGEAAQRQPQKGTGEYGTAKRYGGYGQTTTQEASEAAPISVVKTSNKYKDPCVAPPSCLTSFGFGGNVVTMLPMRKLQSDIIGNSLRNTSRGASLPSEFDDGGDTTLFKGPVNVYRMDQLHPRNSEFEQMDIFPGPLTEDVSDEAILEFLDDHLKRSEAPLSADKAEDENYRLLLGVLRVLVKCNGKLRSDPGMLNPSDPDSPEALLIALLSESSKRRNRNGTPTFPLPRKVQSATPSSLMLKHANDLRELLLVGNRKGAVASAMTAQMWPEAMLIASFTDKEEYKQVLRTYLDEHYATGDPCRALFMSFADQQENSVQEPKRLLQTNVQQQPAGSLILSSWVSHAQVLFSNRTADTNKILTELGDRLWGEVNAVAAAHTCYLLAGIQVDVPTPSSKMALLGGDHRTPAEARFYVSPGAVQQTEIYEWARKHGKGASGNLMIPFQGYKLIYAMLLADHGKLDTAFKYVTSMLTAIKAVTATMNPGTSMYLDGMKNQLTVLDDRLRQHLGQDRVATVAASTSHGGGRKQGGKWGLGSALSIMGKIVNRVVEGNESGAPNAGPSASTPGGLYANEVTACAESYPSTPAMTAPTSSPTSSYPQQHAQQTPPSSAHGPSPVPAGFYGHATPPVSESNALGSSNGHNRASATPLAEPYSRPGVASSVQFPGNGHFAPQQHQQSSSGPLSGNGRPSATGPFPNSGHGSQKRGTAPLMRSQHSIGSPGSNHSTHSNSNLSGMTPQSAPQYFPQQQCPTQLQSPSSHSQGTSRARPSLQKSSSLDVSGDTSSSSQSKSLATFSAAEMAASLPPTNADKGKTGPKVEVMKKPGGSKTPPSSGSAKGSGWLSGLSSFIVTKMNPEAKVAKLGEQMEAYFDEDAKRWVFPGESTPEEVARPSAPPTGPLPGSAPGSTSATGVPPSGTNSAPGSISSAPAPSNDPLAALMAPPPSHMLMKKDPLAAMMVPPSRPGVYGGSRGQRKPPRPQFAVFKPTTTPSLDEQCG